MAEEVYESDLINMVIGTHMSIAKGIVKTAENVVKMNADTMQIFSRNPRGSNYKDPTVKEAEEFQRIRREAGFGAILAHAPYTMNCAGAKENLRDFARETMADDLKRLELTPGNYYNFHPGNHVGQGAETGIARIAEILNEVLTEEQSTTVLLETMSGKGSEIGRNFDELRQIIDRVERKDKMGVCLDTCHVWDGGYDIVNNLDGVFTEFDRLKAIHLNDSMNGLGSHKDRHAKIGEGEIGLGALVRVIRHPATKGIPFILETPNDDEGWTREIALLRKEYEEK
mgnify:CR=1 FL=1